MDIGKADPIFLKIRPEKVDDIVLGEGTKWECKVTRLLPPPSPDSMLFCALVEEIEVLKAKVKELESQNTLTSLLK